uniref:Uncharacterized protein n=1 Tax=viral metagenome TaxID=1070528 RepID=A0A6C0JYA4_9ZZZZ
MGLGLFGTPLYLNEKCLVFSAFVLAIYWLPHPSNYQHKIVTAFVLASLAYILMAWYDYLYDCTDRFGPTFLGWLTMWFKPAEYRKKWNSLPTKYKKIVRGFDIVILMTILGLTFYPYIL